MIMFIAVSILVFLFASAAGSGLSQSTDENCHGMHTADELAPYLSREIDIPADKHDLFRSRLFVITPPPPVPKEEWTGVTVRVFAHDPQTALVVLQQGLCLTGMLYFPIKLLSLLLMLNIDPKPELGV